MLRSLAINCGSCGLSDRVAAVTLFQEAVLGCGLCHVDPHQRTFCVCVFLLIRLSSISLFDVGIVVCKTVWSKTNSIALFKTRLQSVFQKKKKCTETTNNKNIKIVHSQDKNNTT